MTEDQVYGEAARVAASPMLDIREDDRKALAVGITIRGYAADRARRMLFDPSDPEYVPDNDGALQMLARHRRPLAPDVVQLVIAAREVTDMGVNDDKTRALLVAVEEFSSRVPYDDEPEVQL